MYAKWIGADKYIGPSMKKTLVIKNGEIRKIHAKKDDKYILEGREKGYFGWIDSKYLEIINEY